jgi:hypothetical protein
MFRFDPKSAGKMAAEVLQGTVKFDDLVEKANFDPGFRIIGRSLWGAGPMEWAALPSLNNLRFSAIKIAECELTADQFESIFNNYNISEVADQICFISVPLSRELNMNIVDFRREAGKSVGIEMASSGNVVTNGFNLTQAIAAFSQSPSDVNAFHALRSGSLFAAWREASAAHQPTVAGLTSMLCFHRLQKVVKFLEATAQTPNFNLAGWLGGMRTGQNPTQLGKSRADAVFSQLEYLNKWIEKTIRKAAQSPPAGKTMVALNGALPPEISSFNKRAEIECRHALDPAKPIPGNAKAVEEIRAPAMNFLELAAAKFRRLLRVQELRDASVMTSAIEAGISVPSARKVSFFRSFAAGLSPRALIIALSIEAVFVAKRLQDSNVSPLHIISWMDRGLFGKGLPTEFSSLAATLHFIPMADSKLLNLALNLAQIQTAAIGNATSSIDDMRKGGQQEDIALAISFLQFIYEYTGWSNGCCSEESSEQYREYTWRELYARFGLFGHLFIRG